MGGLCSRSTRLTSHSEEPRILRRASGSEHLEGVGGVNGSTRGTCLVTTFEEDVRFRWPCAIEGDRRSAVWREFTSFGDRIPAFVTVFSRVERSAVGIGANRDGVPRLTGVFDGFDVATCEVILVGIVNVASGHEKEALL